MWHLFKDIYKKIHDAKFSHSIQEISKDYWEAIGENDEKPFDFKWVSKDDRQFKL